MPGKTPYKALLGFLLINLVALAGFARETFPGLHFQQLSTLNGLPTNEVRRIYQDNDGLIWIATTSGLCSYDGYRIKTYKANFYTPDLLSNNNIRCLSEDQNHNMWIGTNNGLNVLNKITGEIRKSDDSRFYNNSINTILTTSSGKTLIGTDRGLFYYQAEADSCIIYDSGNTGISFGSYGIQDLFEDSNKQVWISTNVGLFRYDSHTRQFISYVGKTPYHSAHLTYEDSQKQIWVGTMGGGIFRMENPYEPEKLRCHNYQHQKDNPDSLPDNIIYAISEDLNTNALWIGTRSGLSLFNLDPETPRFTHYMPGKDSQYFSFNEVNAIIRDNQGTMWVGMLGGGVNYVNTCKPMFYHESLEQVKKDLSSNAIRSMLLDDENNLWLGIGSYGFIIKNLNNGKVTYYKDLPDFKGIGDLPTITSIMQSPTDKKIWLSTFSNGIFVYDKKGKPGQRTEHLVPWNSSWIPDARIFAVKEDSNLNYWIASKNGVSLYTRSGEGYHITQYQFPGFYYCLEEDRNGNIWAGSGSYGVIRIIPSEVSPGEPVLQSYSPSNGKLNSIDVQCIFQDSNNRLWIGTDGGGLSLFNPEEDKFIAVNSLINMPGDGVFSIEEDHEGSLWIGTNVGLIKLIITEEIGNSKYRLFTNRDGLQDNTFLRGASLFSPQYGMFFGGHNGYNNFHPESLENLDLISPVMITDIKIFNHSWETLDSHTKNKISPRKPESAEKITLNYKQNNFNIEFAALNYTDPMQTQYMYRLKGFDRNWQHTDASRRFGYYNNLLPGSYTFEVYASNDNAIWNDTPKKLQIVILPPPWKTWWAYLIYLASLMLIAYMVIRNIRNRINLRNELRIKEMEKLQAEELNHTKLQFFTNITHELLTPLTIISATVDELKIKYPVSNEYYQTMTNNINRLIRLLQQILEFRKAETGNLKLKVAKGDLAIFARNSVESFIPLIKKKKMHFSLVCNPDPFIAYFDFDKIDKILYNLLSNAAKYNQEGGTVWVELGLDEEKQRGIIVVKDNGRGIAPDAMKSLFTRFYEGDYRRFKTTGTGIGLSLTKDLIDLHGGTIKVESEVDKGTTFTVEIPVSRDAYSEDQIDENIIFGILQNKEEIPLLPPEDKTENIATEKHYSILIIEDNEDLLQLMYNLLNREYRVHTASTGIEGLEVMEQEEVDLVVSDIMMPEMDGIEFSKQVKSNLNICHTPIILLTAKNREEDRIEAYDSGADGFISKPFNLSVLHAKIKNLLKAKERGAKDFKKQLVFEAKELNYTSMDEQFLQRAIDSVHRHLDDPEFDQQLFMEEMGSSKSTLYKKLKSLTGLNTSAFIRNIRLKAACQIAEEKKNIRISELAYAVGFNDPKYFSACFKKEFGMLPREYIETFIPDSAVDKL